MNRDETILERLSESVTSGAPLAVGLRAAATEESGSALSRDLLAIAKRIEKGDSLDTALSPQLVSANAHVPAAIRAGIQSGRLAQVLTELLRHQRFQRRMRSSLWVSLTYPVALVIFLVIVVGFVFTSLIPMFREVYSDFGIALPKPTVILLSFHDLDLRTTLFGFWSIPVGFILLRLWLGKANWRLFLSKMPFFGQIMHWNGVSQFARLLPIFLRQEIPLGQALEFTASGIRDSNIALATKRMANKVQAGGTFASLVQDNHRIPQTAAVMIQWGEESDQLPESLELLAEFGEKRIERRTRWLAKVVPPLVFILIAMTIAGVFIALLLPMVTLVSALT